MRALGENAAGTYSDIAGHHFRQKDEHTLAQLDKNQVLKASIGKPGASTSFSSLLILLSGDSAFARFWLQLYHIGHVGDCIGVSEI